jgi:KipI family sensor histidine kinase inhibitor
MPRRSPHARSRVQTFGLSATPSGAAVDIRSARAHVPGERGEQDLGEFTMPLLGDHNVRNALVAIAVGVDLGLEIERLRSGLAQFKGVKRRLEVVGKARGITIYDDFAHHPTAVDETLKAVRRASPGKRIWAIFEPRSASSCRRIFQDDFAKAFAGADEVVIASVFRSSLPADERLSEAQLVEELTSRRVHARPPARRRHDRRRRRSRSARRRSDRRHVERRLRRDSPQAAVGDRNVKNPPCGDSMLLVELEPAIDPVINERAILLASRIRDAARAACATCARVFDARRALRSAATDLAALEQAIEQRIRRARRARDDCRARGDRDPGQLRRRRGPDLEAVAAFAGCSVDEVIARTARDVSRLHARVRSGFAYMGRVDPSLAAPRHRVPRERVPAGSVGIAGLQTGVYPVESPGGWQAHWSYHRR